MKSSICFCLSIGRPVWPRILREATVIKFSGEEVGRDCVGLIAGGAGGDLGRDVEGPELPSGDILAVLDELVNVGKVSFEFVGGNLLGLISDKWLFLLDKTGWLGNLVPKLVKYFVMRFWLVSGIGRV